MIKTVTSELDFKEQLLVLLFYVEETVFEKAKDYEKSVVSSNIQQFNVSEAQGAWTRGGSVFSEDNVCNKL